MKKQTLKQKRKEFEKFQEEQMRILTGHFSRAMLRCLNKMGQLFGGGE